MRDLAQQIVVGLSSGAVYASLALAIVLVHRATRVLNFAQGELAMLTTFVAWALVHNHGWPYWVAFCATLAIAFCGGATLELLVVRPVAEASALTVAVVTVGVLLACNGLATAVWGGGERAFPAGRPFPNRTVDVAGVVFSVQDVGVLGVSLVAVLALSAFLRFTKAGLGLRAAAVNPDGSRLVGVPVGAMRAVGWGVAAALGAVSGLMAASAFGSFDPNLMRPVLVYALAAAVLGGLDSPVGAVVGGLLVGVAITLLGNYVETVGTGLRLPATLLLILGVLLVRPSGLFGHAAVRRA